MGVSKVVLGEETLVDLTSDSVNEESLLKGATAHNASGEKIEGNVLVPTKISQLENDSGFLNNSSTVNFEQASKRINIQSSDSIKIILGKIMKWFSDLKTVAFSGSYNDLSNKPTIPTIPTPVNNLLTTVSGSALDATQGKVLDDKINAVNSNLSNINVYVGDDEKLHFVDSEGADSVLPFSKSGLTYITHGVSAHGADANVSITNYNKVFLVAWAFNNTPNMTVDITTPSGATVEYDSGKLLNQVATSSYWLGTTRAMIVSGVKDKSIKFNLEFGGQYIVFGME